MCAIFRAKYVLVKHVLLNERSNLVSTPKAERGPCRMLFRITIPIDLWAAPGFQDTLLRAMMSN
ncbi:MAG: hypothetical protein WD823_13230, partial [Sulfuricaulis sp.]|uniref:hypothetical protein n=1 Tax=Sulfuricaulis sp. TaxID=2003553 RepID=UPI0034A18F5C